MSIFNPTTSYNQLFNCINKKKAEVTEGLYCTERILLTAEPIWFSFTMSLLRGPGKIYNYFGEGYQLPPEKKRS